MIKLDPALRTLISVLAIGGLVLIIFKVLGFVTIQWELAGIPFEVAITGIVIINYVILLKYLRSK